MTNVLAHDRRTKLSNGSLPDSFVHIINGEYFGLPNNTECTVWVGPTNVYTFTDVSGGDRITHISSSSVSDIGYISIEGLKYSSNGLWIKDTVLVQLQGHTKTLLPQELIRINSARSLSPLIGNVYIYEDTTVTNGIPNDTTLVRGFIDPDINMMSASILSIPDGYSAKNEAYNIHCAVNASGTLYVMFYLCLENGTCYRSSKLPFSQGATSISELTLPIPFAIPAKSDIYITAVAPLTGYGLFFNSAFELQINRM